MTTTRRAPPGEIELAQGAVALLAGAVLLVSLFQDLTGRRFGYLNMLDVDVEASVYTWLSSGLILINALIILHVAWTRRERGLGDWAAWGVFGATVLGLSAEEIVGLHERFTAHVAPVLATQGVDLHVAAWAIPALALCGLGLAVARPFLRALPASTRWGLLTAGAVYVFGAAGMECLEQAVLWARLADPAPAMILMAHVEEGLEFTGMLLLLRTLLAYDG